MASIVPSGQPVSEVVLPSQLSPVQAVEASNTLLYDYDALLKLMQGTHEDREQILTEIKNDIYKIEGAYKEGEVLPQLAQQDRVFTIGKEILDATQPDAKAKVEPTLNTIIDLMKKSYLENKRILSVHDIDSRDKEKLKANQGMMGRVLLSKLPQNDVFAQQILADGLVDQERTAMQIGSQVCYWGTAGVTTLATGVEVASTVEAGGSVAASIVGGGIGVGMAVAAPFALPIIAEKRKWSTNQNIFAAIAIPGAVLAFGLTGPIMLLATGGVIAVNELAALAKEQLEIDSRKPRSIASEGPSQLLHPPEGISDVDWRKFVNQREIKVKGSGDVKYNYIPKDKNTLPRPRRVKIKEPEKSRTRKDRT